MNGELNLLNLMLEAGIIVQLVVVLLVICSIFSWAIFFQKSKQFKKVKKENDIFLESFRKLNSFKDAPIIINQSSGSPLCSMLDNSHKAYLKILETRGEEGAKRQIDSFGLSSISRAMESGSLESSCYLGEKLNYLASIGSISPFIGLFGTVIGIINSFQGLSQGGGSLESVAPGIAEALVATAIGLAAAIPAVWFYNIFNTNITELNKQSESFSQELLNLVERSI
jgi:biopolymer transport protein TolQ